MDPKTEIKRRLAQARRRAGPSRYGQMCAAMVPHYERILAEMKAAEEEWSKGLRSIGAPVEKDAPASPAPGRGGEGEGT